MASGMVRAAGTDLAVGVTGVAGPSGGTPEKPVGMVAIAAAWARDGRIDTRVRTFNFIGGREMVRFQASQAALDMVRRWLTDVKRTVITLYDGDISTLVCLLVGYLLGSIPFAYLLARRHRGIDLRLAGSGNVGAANLLRTTTKKIGVSAMALDVGKGIASVLVARQIDPGRHRSGRCGHRGGARAHLSGVARVPRRQGRGDDVRRVFDSRAASHGDRDGWCFWCSVWWTRYISLGSVAGSVMLAPLAYVTGAPEVTVVAAVDRGGDRRCTGIGSNLRRVFAGIERRLGQSA